jgi:hypothetical protein
MPAMEDKTFIELQEYHKSIEQEFFLDPKDPPDIIKLKVRDFALTQLNHALNTLTELLNSDKDPTRLAAAKFIVSTALATTPADENNPLTDLFQSLTSESTPPPPPTS